MTQEKLNELGQIYHTGCTPKTCTFVKGICCGLFYSTVNIAGMEIDVYQNICSDMSVHPTAVKEQIKAALKELPANEAAKIMEAFL